MPNQKLEQLAEEILALLPDDGTAIGNLTIMRQLEAKGYSRKEYIEVKTQLLNNGIIRPGRGMGGAISRIPSQQPPELKPAINDKSEMPEKMKRRVIKILLKHLPPNGSKIGNKDLLGKLKKDGITEEVYWAIRNELIVQGLLGKGRGQGGSVYLLAEKPRTRKDTGKTYPFKKEKELYPPFFKFIREYWIKDNDLDEKKCVIEITADQGYKKVGGGKWTRPDITVVAIKTFPFIPGKFLDIISFEIKPANDIDIRGVFETASHSRFAHRSFLAVYLPDGPPESDPKFDMIRSECERFGIGFIYFVDPNKWTTYETYVEAERKNPAPEDVNLFISNQMDKKNQNEILQLLK